MANGLLNDNASQILFPGLTGKPTSKQLIDAAILRASLSLLGGKRPGETTFGAIGRAVEKGAEVTDLLGSTEGYRSPEEATAAAKKAGLSNVRLQQTRTGRWIISGGIEGEQPTLGGIKIDPSMQTYLSGGKQPLTADSVADLYESLGRNQELTIQTLQSRGYTQDEIEEAIK